ncbi:MAG: phospholipid/cholesterol/gamma-HCH transport system substrate-binding protein, partial [Mycobacterium sp.]|nr:phospholipid/cholesterol/gamma-HCH transport system substrate-binding protein [Mycobacterium sp.]
MVRRRSYRARPVAVASLAIAAMMLCGSCAPFSTKQAAQYCAIMPDSVGLYVDNPVTQMGYEIGKVSSITPSALSVRVDFSVDEQRALPANVKAVIRSTSILA